MPLTNHKTAKFDIDFDFGVFSEQQLIDMFENNGKVEVKTERDMWKQTGNIAIEFKYKGKPSGISSTMSLGSIADVPDQVVSFDGVSSSFSV